VQREAIEGIDEYDYQFPPPLIPATPEKPKAGEFVVWKTSGINPIGPTAWLRAQNHWWEFAPRWEEMSFKLSSSSPSTHMASIADVRRLTTSQRT